MSEQFESFLARVIHEKECDAIVAGEVAGTEQLAVAFQVRKPQLIWPEHFQESRRTSSMLDTGPALAICRREVEAISARNVHQLFIRKGVAFRRVGDDLMPSKITLLRCLNIRREHKLSEFFSHGSRY